MAGAATTATPRAGTPTKGAGAAGRAPAPKPIPKDGWQFADLSDPRQLASYKRQLATRGTDEAEGLEALRRLQRAQPGSGGLASDEQPKAPPAAPTSSTPAAGSTPAPRSLPSPSLRPGDGGGFLAGLLLFALGNAFLRYGPAGVTSWLGAKFVNRPKPSIVAAEAAAWSWCSPAPSSSVRLCSAMLWAGSG
jgi:hypothetical protein